MPKPSSATFLSTRLTPFANVRSRITSRADFARPVAVGRNLMGNLFSVSIASGVVSGASPDVSTVPLRSAMSCPFVCPTKRLSCRYWVACATAGGANLPL